MNIKVDQSIYFPGQTRVEKEESRRTLNQMTSEFEDNHKAHPDPFLFTDSKIMTGQGKGLVLAVGENTLLAKSRKPSDSIM